MRLSRGKSGKDVQCRTPGLDQSKTGWAIRQRLASRRELADGLCSSTAGPSLRRKDRMQEDDLPGDDLGERSPVTSGSQ